jgi:hypothetical protein
VGINSHATEKAKTKSYLDTGPKQQNHCGDDNNESCKEKREAAQPRPAVIAMINETVRPASDTDTQDNEIHTFFIVVNGYLCNRYSVLE